MLQNEQAEQPVAKEDVNLKSIESRLREIDATLRQTIGTLKYAVRGEPTDELPKNDSGSLGNPTIETIMNNIHDLGRHSNELSKLTDQLVGN